MSPRYRKKSTVGYHAGSKALQTEDQKAATKPLQSVRPGTKTCTHRNLANK